MADFYASYAKPFSCALWLGGGHWQLNACFKVTLGFQSNEAAN